jgi:hypothetical protein
MTVEESRRSPRAEIPESFGGRILRSIIPLGSEAVSVSSSVRHTPVAAAPRLETWHCAASAWRLGLQARASAPTAVQRRGRLSLAVVVRIARGAQDWAVGVRVRRRRACWLCGRARAWPALPDSSKRAHRAGFRARGTRRPASACPGPVDREDCTTTILARLRTVSGDGRVARLRRLSNARWVVEGV